MRKTIAITAAALLLIGFTGCKKKVDHEAVKQSIMEMLSVQYDADYLNDFCEMRQSDRSPILYEVICSSEEGEADTMLVSIDTKHSRAVDLLMDQRLTPFELPYTISQDRYMQQLTRGHYSCTTDSTIRIVCDSVFVLDQDTLFHTQFTTLYTLHNLRFEKAFEEDKLIRDWEGEKKQLRLLTTDSGRAYNERLADAAGRLLAGDSIGNITLEKLIPANEEQGLIYWLDIWAPDSLRTPMRQLYDSTIVNAATGSYALMDKYLQSFVVSIDYMSQYSGKGNDRSLVEEEYYRNCTRMDAANPLLFRQSACYTLEGTHLSYISDAIREHQNGWATYLEENP